MKRKMERDTVTSHVATADRKIKKPTFSDLFAGIGGFRLGFEQAGFECVYSSEIDENTPMAISRRQA